MNHLAQPRVSRATRLGIWVLVLDALAFSGHAMA
jgi:hypothetical protein